jgi:hypothetical protein
VDLLKKATVYSAHYLQKLSKLDLCRLEDQLCDIWTLLDNYLYEIQSEAHAKGFGGDLYWKDQEVQVTKLYLQDLLFEYPDTDPAILARQALDKAKVVVTTLKEHFEEKD